MTCDFISHTRVRIFPAELPPRVIRSLRHVRSIENCGYPVDVDNECRRELREPSNDIGVSRVFIRPLSREFLDRSIIERIDSPHLPVYQRLSALTALPRCSDLSRCDEEIAMLEYQGHVRRSALK